MKEARRLAMGLAVLGLVATCGRAVAASGGYRVAVMDFTNASTDRGMDPLGKGLQAMMTTDLGKVPSFTLLERARLDDLKAELKLGQSELIDPKTAAKLGKLAGASHIVIGSFTVVGDTMRIDCRLVGVGDGKVLMSEAVSGEKGAFFELQKSLVKKLVAAAGVKLAPKDRYALGKVHTADFEAFRKFSEGVFAFDAKRYQDAVAAMRAASTLDADFELAQLTLGEYERLAQQARGKADAAKVAEQELRRLARDERKAHGMNLLKALVQIAQGEGKHDTVNRQVARLILAYYYAGPYGPMSRVALTEDRFAVARMGDAFHQAAWAEASKTPELPPTTLGDVRGLTEAEVKSGQTNLLGEMRDRLLKEGERAWSPGVAHDLGEHLHLDEHGRADLRAKLFEQVRGKPPSRCIYYNVLRNGQRSEAKVRAECVAEWRTRELMALAKAYQRVMDLDRSTKWAAKASSSTQDSRQLEETARLIEENRDMLRFLQGLKGDKRTRARELLMLDNRYSSLRRVSELIDGGDAQRLADKLLHERGWSSRVPYLLVGGVPLWAEAGTRWMWTGHRPDPARAEAIHYYGLRSGRGDDAYALTVWGPRPSSRVELSVEVLTARPELLVDATSGKYDRKHWDALSPGDRRAAVTLLFGLRDIEAIGDSGGRGRDAIPARPMTGYGVRLGPHAVELVALRSAPHTSSRSGPPRTETVKVLKTWKTKAASKDRVPVRLAVDGRKVTVRVGGKTLRGQLPKEADGFAGFELAGPGYGGLTKLKRLH